jgi:trehalose-phosphatase
MDILNTAVDLQQFFSRLRTVERRLLMLDYDGTLAPFRINRQEAVPYDGIEDVLDHIIDAGACRVVLISGRWSQDLASLLRLRRLPEIWGSHGWERRMPDGTYELLPIPEEPLRGLACMEDWLRDEKLYNLCELKPACIAIHWRGLRRNTDTIRERVAAQMALVPGADALYLAQFDGGVEIRVRGRTKGDAVATLLQETGDNAVVAYCGDDLTDEDAFAVLDGRGLRVLVRATHRATRADVRLAPAEELCWFLRQWHAHCLV